jgi:hypothetical protein
MIEFIIISKVLLNINRLSIYVTKLHTKRQILVKANKIHLIFWNGGGSIYTIKNQVEVSMNKSYNTTVSKRNRSVVCTHMY